MKWLLKIKKQLGGGKKSKRRTSRTISRENRSKTSRSRKIFCQNKKSINQSSHFRYGAFTIFSLESFDKVVVLETINSSHTQEVFPSTSLDKAVLNLNLRQIITFICICVILTSV